MKCGPDKYSHGQLRRLHGRQRAAIRKRLAEFGRIGQEEYFYELAYCLLTPQSSAENAGAVVDKLKERNFFSGNLDPEPLLRSKNHYIRFHRMKSKYLLRTKESFHEIAGHLSGRHSGDEHREWLVNNVLGIGFKEASHFLRNIGYRDLAILDRHILKNLVRAGVISRLPKSLNKRHYLQIEEKFRKFSNDIGIPLDELDLLFWSMETGKILK